MAEHELDVYPLMDAGALVDEEYVSKLADAVDLAADQGQRTWLTHNGKRIAVIVTVADASALESVDRTYLAR